MKKAILPFLILPFAVSAADVKKVYLSTVTNEATRVSLEMTFREQDCKNPLPRLAVTCSTPDARRMWSCDIDAGFTGFCRMINGSFPSGYSGIPAPHGNYYDVPAPKPGEKRRIELVHNRDHFTLLLEIGGKLRPVCRKRVPSGMRLYSVRFPRDIGTISNLAFTKADDAPDPSPVHLDVPAPAAGRYARFLLRPGQYPSQFELTIEGGTTNVNKMTFCSFREHVAGVWLEDAGIVWPTRGNWDPWRVHTRTHLPGRYTEKEIAEFLKTPEKIGEPATKHDFLFEIRKGAKGWALWIDNCFYRVLPGTEEGLRAVRVDMASQGVAKRLPDVVEADDPLRLDLGVPKPFDTSVCFCHLSTFNTECEGYLSRSPFEGHADSFLRRVPADTYAAAIVRCRVDGAATNSCELTARLTNFNCPGSEGRSTEAMTERTVVLPKKDGEYTVRIELEPGRIQDLIHDRADGFLDLELLGGIDQADMFKVRPHYVPSPHRSGVTVLGASLVRAPASLHVANGVYANTFVAGETPSVTARVKAAVGGRYRLEWSATDVDCRAARSDDVSFELAAGETFEKTLSFEGEDIGWYGTNVRLLDAAGKAAVSFDGSYIMIAPDTRKAGYESPFFTWSPIGKVGTNQFRTIGAYLKRLGIRRTQLGKYTEEDAKDFGLTLGTCYHCRWKRDGNRQEQMDSFEKNAREAMAKWPHIDTALIYHEHAGGPPPQELLGGVTTLNEKQKSHQLDTCEGAIWRSEVWRKVAPQVKLQIGNAGDSLGLVAEMLRGKIPADCFDTIGEESTGECVPPEKSAGWAFRNLQDLASLYGYTNRAMACYEWKCRVTRLFYGNLRKHAAWRTRDCLIALVWESRTVPVGSDGDSPNGYFLTCWGSGACTREPLMQPYPVLAATANLTRTLDRCRFVRLVPTGSYSAYLAEFRNPEGQYVYALWTARGEIEAKFRSEASKLVVTDLFGREDKRFFTRRFTAKMSEEPIYFTMNGPIVSADARGNRAYPWEEYAELEPWQVLDPLRSADDWTLEDTREKLTDWKPLNRPDRLLPTQPGSFELATKEDEGRPCVALTLLRKGELKPLASESCSIRLKKPIEIPEDATTIGVEVKGNSSWGKVMFEVECANGSRWLNASRTFGGYGDNSQTMAVNFDGWHRLSFMIMNESPAKCASLEPNMKQWTGHGGKCTGPRVMKSPMKLTAIYFDLRRKAFDLRDWVDVETDTILLRNFSAAANVQKAVTRVGQ